MKKWRRKPVIVDAEVYSLGMEDGFDNDCNWACANIPRVCQDCGCHNKPFIIHDKSKKFISPGDYIVKTEKGKKVYKPSAFLEKFELIGGI